mmetsp:Transcript_34133/g.49597  ORF Transcript_34133/g.49597 Transcript_34133/m.49597 type:complete len:256 (-) Transcript_34133:1462-2229(-)
MMEPYVSGTLQQYSKAFKGKQKQPQPKKEPVKSLQSASQGKASEQSERLKDYMFDPQVDFDDIYGKEETFEMSAEEIANPNNNKTKKELTKSPDRKKSRVEPVLIPECTVNAELNVLSLAADDPFKSFSSVEKLTMEFITNIDFSELQHDDGLSVCKLIGKSFYFIETVCFYRINAAQLVAIFGQWLDVVNINTSNNNNNKNNSSNNDTTQLSTKKIILVDLNRKRKHAIKCSSIYFDLKNKLGMNVKFLAKEDK